MAAPRTLGKASDLIRLVCLMAADVPALSPPAVYAIVYTRVMDRAAELLRQICERPEDDAPRLIYADHLVERGDPRGELIHIQCALGRPRYGARLLVNRRRETEVEAEVAELEKREAALLRKHGKAWLAPIRPLVRTWAWHRGFPDDLTADAVTFLRAVATIRGTVPITKLALAGLDPKKPDHVAAFETELPSLRVLDISQNRIDGKRAPAIFGSPLFAPVHTLDVCGNPFGDDGMAVLAALPQVRALTIMMTGISSEGVRRLAPLIDRLESLNLYSNESLDDSWPVHLAGARRLRVLIAGGTNLGDRGVATLAELDLPALEELTLDHTIGDAGHRALAESPYLGKLTRLTLYVSEERRGPGFAALRKRFGDRVLGLEQ